MSSMQAFWSWWFQELPDFLMSEPIKYIFGLCIFMFVLKILFTIFSGFDTDRPRRLK